MPSSSRPQQHPSRPSRRGLLALAAGAAGVGLTAEPALADGGSARRPLATTPGVLFDADFGRYGFDRYAWLQPQGVRIGSDLGITDDPIRGGRRVAWFDSGNRHHVGTPYPRSGVATPQIIKPGTECWSRIEVLVSSRGNPLASHNDWITLMTGAYGPPYGGRSPLGVSVVRGANRKVVLNVGGAFHWLKEEVEVPLDQWFRLAMNFRLARDGWFELYLDRGRGFEQLRLDGQRRARLATLRSGCNDSGTNDGRIGVYGPRPARAYVASHVIGGSMRAVTGMGR